MLNYDIRQNADETRMVQLPATAAIEYVAAFVTRTRTKTKIVRGCLCLLSGGLMPVPPNFNAYTNRLGFLCLAT